MKLRAVAGPWHQGVDFLVYKEGVGGQRQVVTAMTVELVEPGMEVRPSVTIDRTDAQVLMDDLWNAGLRPTEGTGSAGSLRATEKHLQDMRTIVSKKLDVSL